MKKLLYALLLLLSSSISAVNFEKSHECICKGPTNEQISCDQLCDDFGGWSGKARLENSSNLKGIACICNNMIRERSGPQEVIERPVEVTVGCQAFTGKCRATGWKDRVKNLHSQTSFDISSGKSITDQGTFDLRRAASQRNKN